MKQTILKYGVISGLVSSALMVANIPFMDNLGHGALGALVGYTGMVLAFLLVYFGIRSYRDNECGGSISFGKAFGVGICISLITCVFYVITWEIAYFKFLPGFMDNYGSHAIEQMKAAGASAEAIQKKTVAMETFKKMYNNPLYNSVMTFMEPLPVAILMTLISAVLLRKRVEAVEPVTV